MTREERKEYMKAYYQAHKEQCKAYNQAHKEQSKANSKAWIEANKEKWKEYQKEYKKAYYQAHKEQCKAYNKAWCEANKEQCQEYQKEYMKADLNTLGQTKQSIRQKSQAILNKTTYKRPGYEIHHCFGYEDPSKFIYITKALHMKIHSYLREHNIDASSDHWMDIRDLVNSTDEFMYIKC